MPAPAITQATACRSTRDYIEIVSMYGLGISPPDAIGNMCAKAKEGDIDAIIIINFSPPAEGIGNNFIDRITVFGIGIRYKD